MGGSGFGIDKPAYGSCAVRNIAVVTATQRIQLYQILQEHFGKSEIAAKAVCAIDEMIEEKVQAGGSRREAIAHKDIDVPRTSVHKDIELLRVEIDKKLEMLRGSLETKIAEASAGSLRRVFSIFIALALMIIGLYMKK
jgi:hypothetical protein